MDLHRVRRLTEILVTSQLRSGRSSSDPKAFFGRPVVLAALDAGAFLLAFGLSEFVVASVDLGPDTLGRVVTSVAPFLPLVAASVVLVAGVMFELTTTAKFSGSDAANWLPLTPSEYVASSASAIAYTYSPGVALILGALLPVALAGHVLGLFALAALLCAVGLFEAAVLIEMIRALTQRAGTVTLGRRGHLALVLRAAVLVLVVLAIQILFNPVFLFGSLQALSSVTVVSAFVPLLWPTEALVLWGEGSLLASMAFALGHVAFVALLLSVAGRLRLRYWVATPTEVRFVGRAHRYAEGHPALTALGLSSTEAALVAKDLHGLVRRRELLPILVLPVVLVVLVFFEGGALGAEGSLVWVGWVAGFFALLLATTAVGQERRALQSLYAFPISARNVVRAKAAAVLLPALLATAGMSVAVGIVVGLPVSTLLTLLALSGGSTVVLALWGLVFAARFSDFQERPRPQYLRPTAMIAAMGSGMVLLFAIIVPGSLLLVNPGLDWVPRLGLLAAALGVALTLSVHWVRTGFDRLFRELPF